MKRRCDCCRKYKVLLLGFKEVHQICEACIKKASPEGYLDIVKLGELMNRTVKKTGPINEPP